MNPSDVQKMMKQMGMRMEEIDANEVIIKCNDIQIRIINPQVILANIMGKKVYQVSGEESFEKVETTEEDVKMIMEKTGKDKDTVIKKLKELDNDLAKVIAELQKK